MTWSSKCSEVWFTILAWEEIASDEWAVSSTCIMGRFIYTFFSFSELDIFGLWEQMLKLSSVWFTILTWEEIATDEWAVSSTWGCLCEPLSKYRLVAGITLHFSLQNICSVWEPITENFLSQHQFHKVECLHLSLILELGKVEVMKLFCYTPLAISNQALISILKECLLLASFCWK